MYKNRPCRNKLSVQRLSRLAFRKEKDFCTFLEKRRQDLCIFCQTLRMSVPRFVQLVILLILLSTYKLCLPSASCTTMPIIRKNLSLALTLSNAPVQIQESSDTSLLTPVCHTAPWDYYHHIRPSAAARKHQQQPAPRIHASPPSPLLTACYLALISGPGLIQCQDLQDR